MSTTVVETREGKVEGERRAAHVAFRGIPYAKPPLGALRFAAPQPMEPWSGVRNATAFGASSLQGAMFAPGVLAEGPQSEDCLYLNVFTPSAERGKQRAVMVFIHGGAFTVGTASSALYDGARLAEWHDVVVVTLNYRVGALGYLALGADAERWGGVENRGQHDQLAALRWVQRNIEAFGGDPDNVTLFGESAGATAVCLMLATPSARGTFRRAISQSSPSALKLPTADERMQVTRSLLSALALRDVEQLRDVPADTFIRAQAEVERGPGWPHFYPVEDALFGGQPRDTLMRGEGSDVPLILGTNRDEWNLFAVAKMPEWEAPLDDAELHARVARKLPTGEGDRAASIVDVYRGSRRERALPYGNRALLRAIEGDVRFRIPTVRFAELHRERVADTFLYLFTYGSPALRGALGACHALELPFVFGTVDAPNQDRFAGAGEAVEQLARTVTSAWTTFAKSASTHSSGIAEWSRYELAQRATLELDVEPRLVADSFGAERRAWDGLL